MGDTKLLDTNQIINGLAVLLSFFVGYKYALKKHDVKENEPSKEDQGASGSSTTKEPVNNFIKFKYLY